MIADTASRCGCKDMNARDLVQVAPIARVTAGNAGRERGPSQSLSAFAVGRSERETPRFSERPGMVAREPRQPTTRTGPACNR